MDFHKFIQEVKLWKGENPMRMELGVDYFAIFEKRAYVETEINKVIENYKSKFNALTLEKVETDEERGVLYLTILVKMNEELIRLTLGI